MGFLDDYALIGNEAIEKILLTPSVGVMPRFSPTGGNDAPTPVRERDLKFHGACFSFDGPKGCRGRAESPVQASGCDNFAMKISLVGA